MRARGIVGLVFVGISTLLALPRPILAFGDIQEKYDRITNTTTLMLDLGPYIDSRLSRLYLNQDFKGDGLRHKYGSASLVFTAITPLDAGWGYLDNHSVALLIDGESMRFSSRYSGKIIKGGIGEQIENSIVAWAPVIHSRKPIDGLGEGVGIDLTEAQLRKLYSAHRIEGRVGNDEFVVTAGDIAKIRGFVDRFTPKTPEQLAKEAEERRQREEATKVRMAAEQEAARKKAIVIDKSRIEQKLKLGSIASDGLLVPLTWGLLCDHLGRDADSEDPFNPNIPTGHFKVEELGCFER